MAYLRGDNGGIVCPNCGEEDQSEIKDSRNVKGGKRRRRECKCGYRFSTLEIIVPSRRRNCK